MSPGLWDPSAAYNKFAAPVNAFVRLDDYQPMKGGGLRPFVAPTTISLAGGPGAGEYICGVFARSGVIRTGAGGTGNGASDIVIVTLKSSDDKFRVYRLDNTVGAPAWSLRYTTSAGSDDSHKPVGFAFFHDTNGVDWLCFTLQGNGANSGLFTMRYDYTVASNTGNDGLVANVNTDYGPIATVQARLFVGQGNNERIDYSDVGLTTFSGATHGTAVVTPNKAESVVTSINGIEPSDVLIGKEGAPWVEINGDISAASTPVRELGDDHHPRSAKQQCPKTPGGICFLEPDGRVFETDGRSFKVLTNQLGARTRLWTGNMVASGTMAYLNGYLTIPGNDADTSGVIYDFETDALFRITGINPVTAWADQLAGKLYAANHNSTTLGFVLYDLYAGARVQTAALQTVPYADKNGRNIDVREVQMYVMTAAASEFKVELIDENDASVATRYVVVPAAKRDIIKVQFPATKSGYLSCKITTKTYDGSSEAPTFERIRIGFGVNNLVSVG